MTKHGVLGNTLRTAGPVRDTSPIRSELNNQEAFIASCEELVLQLKHKLEPVLDPHLAETNQSVPATDKPYSVLSQLLDNNSRINTLANMIKDILDRVQV